MWKSGRLLEYIGWITLHQVPLLLVASSVKSTGAPWCPVPAALSTKVHLTSPLSLPPSRLVTSKTPLAPFLWLNGESAIIIIIIFFSFFSFA